MKCKLSACLKIPTVPVWEITPVPVVRACKNIKALRFFAILLLVLFYHTLPHLAVSQSALAQASVKKSVDEPAKHSADESALYQVTFTSTWSTATHPHPQNNFPANAHWSPLVGAVHNRNLTLWATGELASAGIEQMAETGGTSVLRSEITAAGTNAYTTLTGSGLGTASGVVSLAPFSVTKEFPLVTLVSMIAPSPDWFVGVANLSLLDANQNWQEQVVVTLYPYDAGSDDGVDYSAADSEPNPHHLIANYTGVAPFSAAPLGTFTFRRIPITTTQYALYLPLVQQRNEVRVAITQ